MILRAPDDDRVGCRRTQPSQLVNQAQYAKVVGEQNICENVLEALRAEEVYEGRAEFETGESDSAILQR